MMTTQHIAVTGYENVVKAIDPETGLKAIIAVHNTNLGPAVGGTRLYPYTNEEEALNDVLRLSKGMTYKSALAGVNFGGGKSVIIADPSQKDPALLKKFGEFVHSLSGTYICAEDMNTNLNDMEVISTATPHVLGRAGGDPSPLTSLGVFTCIKITSEEFLSIPMKDLRIAIQGVGSVGSHLIEQLYEAGVRDITIADVNSERVAKLAEKFGCKTVAPSEIHTVSCDIFAPCAMGAILNARTIPTLNCKAVVGAANNQLETAEDAQSLHDRGILYAPDYLVNAGGIINVYYERMPTGYDATKAREAVTNIGNTLREIFSLAEKENILTAVAADRVAEKRFQG